MSERIKVVLSAAVTYIVLASTVVTIFAEEIAKVAPADWRETVVRIGVRVVSVLTAAVTIIRRVTPVLPGERGLLPKEG